MSQMRCSRHSGVILELVIITAISWPMVHSIRHSRFAALTLAKLVASLALHPPVSATGRGGLRASPPPAAEPLLKEKPFGGRSLQLSLIAAQDFPYPTTAPWHADRRSAQGVRSTTKGESRKRTEESLLSSGRFRLSPATGVARATSSLKPAAFPSTTQVLYYFLH